MASTNSTTKEKTRQTRDKDAMANAIKAIRDKQMVFLKASKTYGVPKTTLIRLSKMEDQSLSDVTNHKLGRKSTLPSELEAELCDYIVEMPKKQPKIKERSQQKENHRLEVLIKVIIQSMIVPMKVLIVPKIKMVNVCIVMGFFLKTFMKRNGSNVHHVGSGLMKNVLA